MIMNKKVLTLCVSALLSGGMSLAYVAPVNAAIPAVTAVAEDPVQEVAPTFEVNTVTKLTGNYTVAENATLTIEKEGATFDGQGYTLTGHLVIKANNVTVKNLNIKSVTTGSTRYTKTAITVGCDSNGSELPLTGIVIDHVTIEAEASDGLLANGISINTTAENATCQITNTTIGSSEVKVNTWYPVGIIVNAPQSKISAADYFASGNNNKFSGAVVAAVQYANGGGYTYAHVTPNDAENNGLEHYLMTMVSKTKGVIDVDATSEKVLAALANNATSSNATDAAAVIVTSDKNLLVGEPEATLIPDNGKPTATISVNDKGEILQTVVTESPAEVFGYQLQPTVTDSYSMLILHSSNNGSDYAIVANNEGTAEAVQLTAENIDSYATNKSALWKVTETKRANGEIEYSFKNQNDVQLKSAEGAGTGTEGVFAPVNNIAYNKGVAFKVDGLELNLTSINYFGLYKAGNVALTGAQLNGFEKDGFSVTITCDKQNDSKWDDELAGNPFVGHLTAMKWNGTDFSVSTSDGSYYLKNSDGKYIVAEKYDGEGSDALQAIYGFTTISEADLKLHLQRVANGLETTQKYYGEFSAEISAADVNADILGLETLVSLRVNEIGQVGRYDFSGVPTLAVSATTDMKPIQIKMGSNLIVDWKEFLQKGKFYTVERTANGASKHTLGKVVADAVSNSGDVTGASVVSSYGNVLEGQWAVTYDGSAYTFTNRENANVSFTIQSNSLYLTKNNAANTYRYGEDTYVIKPVAEHAATDGYKTLSDLKNTKFNIGFSSSVFDGNAWFTENHEGTSNHTIGLDTDIDNALVFTATEHANARSKKLDGISYKYNPTDSIYVISTLGYYNAELKNYAEVSDTLKVVSYSFVNQWGEPLLFNETGNKYESSTDKTQTPVRFTLREDGEKLNLRPVTLDATVQDEPDYNAGTLFNTFGLNYNKVYAGDAANGILANVGLYDRTENDLFVVEPTAKPMYRKVVNNLDTISIFRQENDKQMLFEDGKFLGLKNATQFDFAPAMLADTAYVRYNTYRPQYLLAVDPVVHGETTWCPLHGYGATCEHADTIKSYVEGRYLVNLVDTAIAWDKANKHKVGNPYINSEKYYRLGFVQATHRNDSLIIANDNNRIFLGNNDYNLAKFAFRYVDQNAGSFVIETANYKQLPDATKAEITGVGYIKWMNGVVVVVDDIENADVFNMNENEEGNPTANETIAAGNVVVAGVDGAVVVKGAEGKNVIVSTILGKVVANEVLTSDNAQIAAPAGIVVVSVDGESFKVVVK